MKAYRYQLSLISFAFLIMLMGNISVSKAQATVPESPSSFHQLPVGLPAVLQEKLIDSLAVELAGDNAYKNYVHNQDQILEQLLSMKRGVRDSVAYSSAWTRERKIEYYKAKGMADPELFMDARDQMTRNMLRVLLKYPAYSRLPKEVKKLVDTRARGIINSKK